MAKKGQTFEKYSEELKQRAVDMYLSNNMSYESVNTALGIRNYTQVKVWVKKHLNGEAFTDQRWKNASLSPIIGRTCTKFKSIEERDYLKVQVEYLKKPIQIYTGRSKSKRLAYFI